MDKTNDKLIHNFYKAARLMGRGMFFAGREHGRGMHRGQDRLLSVIKESQPAQQRELVEKLDIRPSSLSELLKKLEEKNLITRTQDQQDKRNVIVSLTEEGEKRAEENSKDDFSTALFSALDEGEQQKLNELLEKLIGTWQKEFEKMPHEARRGGFGPHGFGPRGHHKDHGFGPRGFMGGHPCMGRREETDGFGM